MVYVHLFVVMVFCYTCTKIAMMVTWCLGMVAHFARLTQDSYVLANLWEFPCVLGPLQIAQSTTLMVTVQSAQQVIFGPVESAFFAQKNAKLV